ncbi:hypothetical protein [Streptomyces diastatochromogenes]|uniref:hypothetical protein n=1 Tax=Streptomyces diastatochromogenes TaxID=42236 RepID=UPI0036BC8985
MPGTRTSLAAAAGALTLLCCAAAPAAADQPPQSLAGPLISGGADGHRHEVFCPGMQHVQSGGYALSAKSGTEFSEVPADVLENRPNSHATGWIVAVRKTTWQGHDSGTDRREAGPADLRIHLVCTDDTMSHGA